MTRKLVDIPLKRIAIEHYLFDCGYPVEQVSEIYGMDTKTVQEIYDNYKERILPTA